MKIILCMLAMMAFSALAAVVLTVYSIIDVVGSVARKVSAPVLIAVAALSSASVYAMADTPIQTDIIVALFEYVVGNIGSFTWLDWLIAGVVGFHFLAAVYVNFTDTPDDNTLYGKLYRYLIEPFGGVILKHKVKQKPFSDMRLK